MSKAEQIKAAITTMIRNLSTKQLAELEALTNARLEATPDDSSVDLISMAIIGEKGFRARRAA